ncbi:MAG: hypothetical protein LUH16_03500, partial [Clostridiales bacterium]|nr:hypothetical protein [Clostridiales bacterium]
NIFLYKLIWGLTFYLQASRKIYTSGNVILLPFAQNVIKYDLMKISGRSALPLQGLAANGFPF